MSLHLVMVFFFPSWAEIYPFFDEFGFFSSPRHRLSSLLLTSLGLLLITTILRIEYLDFALAHLHIPSNVLETTGDTTIQECNQKFRDFFN